jgi:hypothetical protein
MEFTTGHQYEKILNMKKALESSFNELATTQTKLSMFPEKMPKPNIQNE